MALNKQQIDILTDNYIVSLYEGLEQEVINDIARRLNKTGRYTETAEIQARNLRDLGFSTSEIQTEVMKILNADPEYRQMLAENTREYKQQIKELIKEVEAEAAINGDYLIAQAGEMSWNDDMQMWAAHNIDLKKPATISQLQKAFEAQTQHTLKNLTNTTAFTGTMFGNTSIQNAYQRAVDMATLKVATGSFSYQQAIVDTIKDLSRGFSSIDYASGRKYHIDTAARMATRTALSQMAGRITEENLKTTDVNLVYVDAHPGARPEHAAWQGKVYAYKGKTKKYRNFFEATDYGAITGLKGVNCTHNFYPYWEGDPIPVFEDHDSVTVDEKEYTYYEATQKQRQIERQIRETKREINALKACKDPKYDEDLKKAQTKLQQQVEKYNGFSNKAGIETVPSRLRVYDGVASAKKAANQTKQIDLAKLKDGMITAPMDSDKYKTMKNNLEKQGVKVMEAKGDDYRYMIAFGGEATYNDGMIKHIGEVPSASGFFEEIIHWTQEKKYGVITGIDPEDMIERDAREVAANRMLLKYGKSYGFKPDDFEDIRKNLDFWEKSFERRTGNNYDDSEHKRYI